MSLLTTTDALRFLTHLGTTKAKKHEVKRKEREVKRERENIPCSLVLCIFPGPGGALSHSCPRRQVLPQLPLLGFQPHLSLWRSIFSLLFFFLQHLLFYPSPSPLLHCPASTFHTLIACISHRSPLVNCIILMVFFMIVLCGKFCVAY